jgi:CRISPR-associated endonuclease/helicase Cas3
MTVELDTSHFAAFFSAVNPPVRGRPAAPFPWQRRLVIQLAETGQWPDLLDLPTAAGKTAAIDIAVFLMALREDAPRRVVFVIDRRVVVQQAAERARRLAEQLRSSDNAVVQEVANCLRSRAASLPDSDDSPLRWAEMRGGIVRDESWALRPDIPAVLVSTVDQVGSRLLFRGYGVSRNMRPVHAGLLGNDVLFLLDEVHLAQPFAETLRYIGDRYRPPVTSGIPDRWQVAELSATPAAPVAERSVFRLGDQDRDSEVAPVLAQRLAARKMAEKRLVRGKSGDGARGRVPLAHEAAKSARSALAHAGAKVVGVVVNRVNTARQAYELLRDEPDFDACLVTGRMRPFDRDDLLREISDRISTGRDRGLDGRPIVIVATQSIEVGADFDFDALVTECASFDALKQRFGRVDRNGELSAQHNPSQSVILAVADDVAAKASDPIYKEALACTWDWLPDGKFNFAALRLTPEIADEVTAPKPNAPVLLSSHLDRWVQTCPYPDASPDVGLWLHGTSTEHTADVNLVWRADLTERLLKSEDAELAVSLVTACRPGSGEAMSVPITAVKVWLAHLADEKDLSANVQVADVDGVSVDGPEAQPGSGAIRPVLRWRGDESQVAIRVADIRPGDTLIVPAAYGGMSAGNWDPGDRSEVRDLGHRVQAEQRLRAVLRLTPAVLTDPDLPVLPSPAAVDLHDDVTDDAAVRDWLESARLTLDTGRLTGRLVGELLNDKERAVIRVKADDSDDQGGSFFVVSSRRRLPDLRRWREPVGDTVDSEPDTSSFSGAATPLRDHLKDVETWALRTAAKCGLPPSLASDLALAGRLHDVGKSDPRFQVMLHRGRLPSGELLAKSIVPANERVERERARREAGYPRGGRHELLSVAMVQENPDLAAEAHDWELVLHLVASHHGYCRPFAPAVYDPHPDQAEFTLNGVTLRHSTATELARIDAGVADRFWTLVRRYGWFGLARLESILRLADHRASSAEQAHADGHAEEEVMA